MIGVSSVSDPPFYTWSTILLSYFVSVAFFSFFKVYYVRSRLSWRLPETIVRALGLREMTVPPPAYEDRDRLL